MAAALENSPQDELERAIQVFLARQQEEEEENADPVSQRRMDDPANGSQGQMLRELCDRAGAAGLLLARHLGPFGCQMAVSAITYSAGLSLFQFLGMGLRVSCHTRYISSALGALGVGTSSALAGHATRSLARWLEWDDHQLSAARTAASQQLQGGGRRKSQAQDPVAPVWPSRREQLREALLDALVGVTVFKACHGSFRTVMPSDLRHPGAFAHTRLPIRGAGYNGTTVDRYASTAQKRALHSVMQRDGCHHCGARVSPSQVVADHQPPSAVVKQMHAAAEERGRLLGQLPAPFDTVATKLFSLLSGHHSTLQHFYAQCSTCSLKQATLLRHGGARNPLVIHRLAPPGVVPGMLAAARSYSYRPADSDGEEDERGGGAPTSRTSALPWSKGVRGAGGNNNSSSQGAGGRGGTWERHRLAAAAAAGPATLTGAAGAGAEGSPGWWFRTQSVALSLAEPPGSTLGRSLHTTLARQTQSQFQGCKVEEIGPGGDEDGEDDVAVGAGDTTPRSAYIGTTPRVGPGEGALPRDSRRWPMPVEHSVLLATGALSSMGRRCDAECESGMPGSHHHTLWALAQRLEDVEAKGSGGVSHSGGNGSNYITSNNSGYGKGAAGTEGYASTAGGAAGVNASTASLNNTAASIAAASWDPSQVMATVGQLLFNGGSHNHHHQQYYSQYESSNGGHPGSTYITPHGSPGYGQYYNAQTSSAGAAAAQRHGGEADQGGDQGGQGGGRHSFSSQAMASAHSSPTSHSVVSLHIVSDSARKGLGSHPVTASLHASTGAMMASREGAAAGGQHHSHHQDNANTPAAASHSVNNGNSIHNGSGGSNGSNSHKGTTMPSSSSPSFVMRLSPAGAAGHNMRYPPSTRGSTGTTTAGASLQHSFA